MFTPITPVKAFLEGYNFLEGGRDAISFAKIFRPLKVRISQMFRMGAKFSGWG